MQIIYLFLAFFLSIILQIIVIKYSNKKKLFIDEKIKPQKHHKKPTPRAGGISIFLTNTLIIFLNPLGYKLIIAGFFAFLSGIIEDFKSDINPKTRLILQSISGILSIFLFEIVIRYLGFNFEIPYIIGFIFTIFAIVGFINSVNIIDGFNGLASFISILIFISFLSVAIMNNDYLIIYFSILNILSIISFLIFNFPNAKIFLGDGGSYYLGFNIAFCGIYLATNHESISPWFVLAVLSYPVFEVLFSIYRRKKRGYSAFNPDGVHLHTLIHRRITRDNPKTTILILAFVSPFTLVPIMFYQSSIICFLSSICFIIIYIFMYKKIINFKY